MKFEVGKKYYCASACDHECIFEIKVIKRTEKSITYNYMGETKRSKIHYWDGDEEIIPERYSMAPVFRARG